MTKKAATLKNLKVRVNKDGTLSKKSLEDVQGLVKPSVGEKMASRLTVHDGVEAVGFAGLIAVNYYGIDLLGMFLGQATMVVEDIIETVEDFNTAVTEKFGDVGITITVAALVTTPAFLIGVGMPTVVVKETVGEIAGSAKHSIEGQKAALDAQIRLQRDLIGHTTDPEEIAGREALIANYEAQKLTVTKIESGTDPEAQKPLLQKLQASLFVKKVAIATGMAYAEKKFLESYNYFKAVENVPFVE